MLRDINLYMTIPHSISNLDLKVPSWPVVARFKCPFPGNFTMPLFWAGGNTRLSAVNCSCPTKSICMEIEGFIDNRKTVKIGIQYFD